MVQFTCDNLVSVSATDLARETGEQKRLYAQSDIHHKELWLIFCTNIDLCELHSQASYHIFLIVSLPFTFLKVTPKQCGRLYSSGRACGSPMHTLSSRLVADAKQEKSLGWCSGMYAYIV